MSLRHADSQWHVSRRRLTVPSVSTIWRVLGRRGFVSPQPKKRPRSSFIRFEAALPNECWQSDTGLASAPGPSAPPSRMTRPPQSPAPRSADNGLGRAHAGGRVVILVADLDVRVLSEDGEVIRQLVLDPARNYQRRGP